jgi:hypothetical protein
MSANWDHDKGGRDAWVSWLTDILSECLRVARPGAHAFVWALPRTSGWTHRALEDAGWEVRDCCVHIFGSGFPKSLDVGRAIDREEKSLWDDVINKLIDIETSVILDRWKEQSGSAKRAAPTSPKNQTATGINTPKSDSVPALAVPLVSPERSLFTAIRAELSSSVHHPTQQAKQHSVQWSAASSSTGSSGLATIAEHPPESLGAKPDIAASFVAIAAPLSPSVSSGSLTRAEEALKTWLGSSKSSRQAATDALCVALTDALKRTTFSQSETFRSLDMIQQTDFVSAISVTITESTAALLISSTVDTLRNKALNKAAGAEREIIGDRVRLGDTRAYGHNSNGAVYGQDNDHLNDGFRPPITAPATDLAREWQGWGTALKPAAEFWYLARKPLAEKSIAANVARYGTGAINVDGCRIEGDLWSRKSGAGSTPYGSERTWNTSSTPDIDRSASGRWPANLILSHSSECREIGVKRVRGTHRPGPAGFPNKSATLSFDGNPQPHSYADEDGYETVTAWECAPDCAVAMLDAQSGERGGGSFTRSGKRLLRENPVYGVPNTTRHAPGNYGDTGGASRFFYTAKASRAERNAGLGGPAGVHANMHPT